VPVSPVAVIACARASAGYTIGASIAAAHTTALSLEIADMEGPPV
jgi:hypothetical protein